MKTNYPLSKSRYCEYMTCPKKAWMSEHRPEERVIDPATQMRFEIGKAVEQVARGLFPRGCDAEAAGPDGAPDVEAMAARTRLLMEDPDVDAIYGASFVHDGCCCVIDVLSREDRAWTVNEVKSSTKEKDGYKRELAFQHHVLESCGIDIARDVLILIDPTYVRGDELDLDGLFWKLDLTGGLSEALQEVGDNVAAAKRTLGSPDAPACGLSMGCHTPCDCLFWNHCSGEALPENSVFDLYRMTWKKKLALYDQGCTSFAQVDGQDWLSDIQQRQITYSRLDMSDYVDRGGISRFLDSVGDAPCFLDFKTVAPAIPIFKGTSPYQQIPVLYSLHIALPDGSLEHRGFLAHMEDRRDPRREVAESLCKSVPDGATVLSYAKTFECTRLKELAELFPDLSGKLLGIRDRTADLASPFQKGMYYNHRMGGSFSIRSVLPALFPDDPAFGHIQPGDGGGAMDALAAMAGGEGDADEQGRQEQMRRCEMDTLAMARIWGRLKESVA